MFFHSLMKSIMQLESSCRGNVLLFVQIDGLIFASGSIILQFSLGNKEYYHTSSLCKDFGPTTSKMSLLDV